MPDRIIKFIGLCCLLPLCAACVRSVPAAGYLLLQGPRAETSRFEPSGAANDGRTGTIFVFNDKHDEPTVYAYRLEQTLVLVANFQPVDVGGRPLEVRKFEDAASSRKVPGEVYAITSCDRPDPSFNKLLKMSPRPQGGWVFEDQPGFSLKVAQIRERLRTPFLKIEALAISADDRDVFLGVREIGPNSAEPRYVVMIWRVALREDSRAPEKVLEFSTAQQVGRDEGISALEYDGLHHRYLMLTSFEGKGDRTDDVGGHLWSLAPEVLEGNAGDGAIELLDTFRNKPEGVAIGADGRIIVVFDDDAPRKEADPRKARQEGKFNLHQNQAYYTILEPGQASTPPSPRTRHE